MMVDVRGSSERRVRTCLVLVALLAALLSALVLRFLGVGAERKRACVLAVLGAERGLPGLAVLHGEQSVVLCPGTGSASWYLARLLACERARGQLCENVYCPCLPSTIRGARQLAEKMPMGSFLWYGETVQTSGRLRQVQRDFRAAGWGSRCLERRKEPEAVPGVSCWEDAAAFWLCRCRRSDAGGWHWELQYETGERFQVSWEEESGLLEVCLERPGEARQRHLAERHSQLRSYSWE